MSGSLLVLGAGGHGRVVADAALAAGYGRLAFLDDNIRSQDAYPPVIGRMAALADFRADWRTAIAAVGDNRRRLEIFALLCDLGFETPSIVHPSAVVSPKAHIGRGVFAAAGAIVNIGARVGDGVIVNTGATVDHDCAIAAGAHISPGANLAGDVTVDECAWVGIGSAVRNGVRIGRHAIVGAGSAVINDVPENAKVAGSPARAIS